MQIYVAQRDPAQPVHRWYRPHPIPPPDDVPRVYFDPEITVDTTGALIVTFSGAPVAAGTPGDSVPLVLPGARIARFLALSTDAGHSFRVVRLPTYEDWDPAGLPYHCFRHKAFLGEYRRPASLGVRAFHPLPTGGSTDRYVYWSGRMLSQWTLLP